MARIEGYTEDDLAALEADFAKVVQQSMERVCARAAELLKPAVVAASPHVFHLPGKHDQKSHARGGGGYEERPVKVLKQNEWIARGRYQLSDDPDVRANNIWAESYGGQQGIRDTMRGMHEGRANPADDVDVEADPFLNIYASSGNFMADDNQTYGVDRVRDDIHNAALRLDTRLESPDTIEAPLYRGMRVTGAETKMKVGDTFDSDVSSWTTHESHAGHYTRPQKGSGRPEDGTPVIMRISGGSKGINLDDGSLYAQAGTGEHLLRGTFEITGASFEGDTYFVDVVQT